MSTFSNVTCKISLFIQSIHTVTVLTTVSYTVVSTSGSDIIAGGLCCHFSTRLLRALSLMNVYKYSVVVVECGMVMRSICL